MNIKKYRELIKEILFSLNTNKTRKNLFNKFINWLKSLGNDSKITIEPKDEEENSNLIESKDDKVTINIPTVNQFDNIMNKIIDTIKNYIFVENKAKIIRIEKKIAIGIQKGTPNKFPKYEKISFIFFNYSFLKIL